MKTGDTIKWKSQSGGTWKEKIGTVVSMVPKGDSARKHIPNTAKKSHIKFDKDVSDVADRVLVAVRAGKDGKTVHYYCPSVNVLRLNGIEI